MMMDWFYAGATILALRLLLTINGYLTRMAFQLTLLRLRLAPK